MNDMSILLESCCTTPEQAARAAEKGASRIELCECIEVGGITPSEENIRATVALGLPVNVLVRPRGGDFVFSREEEAGMLEDIRMCRRLGASGVVIGALDPEGNVDMSMMERLVAEARGKDGGRRLTVTFHRAFDECRDPYEALEQIISLGCDRLLTSGQKPTAFEGRALIAGLVRKSAGRIIIMPGAGITPDNLAAMVESTCAEEFHGTRIC